MRDNQIEDSSALFKILRKLPKLQHLDISGNQIQRLSPRVGELTELKSLNVGGNPGQEKLPITLGKCRQLKKLLYKTNDYLGTLFSESAQFSAQIRGLQQRWMVEQMRLCQLGKKKERNKVSKNYKSKMKMPLTLPQNVNKH